MILLGISGKKGSGKDTLAYILVKKYGFIKKSFAQELKSAVRRDFNLSKEQTDGDFKEAPTLMIKGKYHDSSGAPQTEYWTPRDIMVEYGQFFRRFDPNYWVKKVFNSLSFTSEVDYIQEGMRVVISDVRFKNEADYIKELGGFIIRLNRRPELNIYGSIESKDISEIGLDDYLPDYKLSANQNIDIVDLTRFADHIMERISVKK